MKAKAEKSRPKNAEELRCEIGRLIRNFEAELKSGDLRKKVLALVPIFSRLRDLGKALIPSEYAASARDRILFYFQKYPRIVLKGDEILVVSGIQDYPRCIRELRVQFGWAIASGVTIKEMRESDDAEIPQAFAEMKPDQYVLFETNQDRDSAHRWALANTIRKLNLSVKEKILRFLRENVSRPVTGEELRYVAGNKTEWARRVRELRTELGWPIATRNTGLPELSVGVYLLQADRQSPAHDRIIPDDVRRDVLRRDDYKCNQCGWTHGEWNASDPRHLEIHHIEHHAKGGSNQPTNLRTLCTVCHDKLHRMDK